MMDTKQYVTKPYRYANGVRYRSNLHLILPFEDGLPGQRCVGGLIELKGRYLAFAAKRGAAILVQEKIERIIRDADAYAWGTTKREALLAIKPHLVEV